MRCTKFIWRLTSLEDSQLHNKDALSENSCSFSNKKKIGVGLPTTYCSDIPSNPVLYSHNACVSLSLFMEHYQGIARTQSPTNKNYAAKLPTFVAIVGVSQFEVQWISLTLGEPPWWSWLTPQPGKYAELSDWAKLAHSRWIVSGRITNKLLERGQSVLYAIGILHLPF